MRASQNVRGLRHVLYQHSINKSNKHTWLPILSDDRFGIHINRCITDNTAQKYETLSRFHWRFFFCSPSQVYVRIVRSDVFDYVKYTVVYTHFGIEWHSMCRHGSFDIVTSSEIANCYFSSSLLCFFCHSLYSSWRAKVTNRNPILKSNSH